MDQYCKFLIEHQYLLLHRISYLKKETVKSEDVRNRLPETWVQTGLVWTHRTAPASKLVWFSDTVLGPGQRDIQSQQSTAGGADPHWALTGGQGLTGNKVKPWWLHRVQLSSSPGPPYFYCTPFSKSTQPMQKLMIQWNLHWSSWIWVSCPASSHLKLTSSPLMN